MEYPVIAAEWDFEKNRSLNINDYTSGSEQKVWWIGSKCGHSWLTGINNRVFGGTNCPYCAGKKVLAGFNDLQTRFPDVAAEWCYEKNGGVMPDMVAGQTNKDYWWICKLGHTWKTSPNHRAAGNGCPYCGGKNVLIGFNDLKTAYPELAKQWDYAKNKNRPEHYTAGSDVKVWWKCRRKHSWQAVISSRSGGKHDCPYCSRHYHLTGETDLMTVNPALAAEWDYKKNAPLTPDCIAPNDRRKLWWICELGHGWAAQVNNRSSGTGCPFCNNKRTLAGFNDLNTVNPTLASQWDEEKNGALTAEMVVPNSGKSVWWKCGRNHSWEAVIAQRNAGHDCPYCKKRKLAVGETDLKAVRPDLADDWDYEKNAPLMPEDVFAQSTERVWWKCSKGHSYETVVCNRYWGNGCPYCSGSKPIVGETDLATTHPHLLDEWDYDANANLRPENFTAGSNIKIWWKCRRGHNWRSAICHRTAGSQCVYCRRRLPYEGETDLMTEFPELVSEWDYAKNEPIKPIQILSGSNVKVWWLCKRGHSWQASVAERTKGTKCPRCSGKTPMRTHFVT
jgi:hypothetical protein